MGQPLAATGASGRQIAIPLAVRGSWGQFSAQQPMPVAFVQYWHDGASASRGLRRRQGGGRRVFGLYEVDAGEDQRQQKLLLVGRSDKMMVLPAALKRQSIPH